MEIVHDEQVIRELGRCATEKQKSFCSMVLESPSSVEEGGMSSASSVHLANASEPPGPVTAWAARRPVRQLRNCAASNSDRAV